MDFVNEVNDVLDEAFSEGYGLLPLKAAVLHTGDEFVAVLPFKAGERLVVFDTGDLEDYVLKGLFDKSGAGWVVWDGQLLHYFGVGKV